MGRRIITTEIQEEDIRTEYSLRPQTLTEYIGQEKAKENLRVYIQAAKARGEALDHVLFFTALRDLERLLLQELLPMRWACA